MLRVQKCLLYWSCILMRLAFLNLQCDARTVNVSNTWTMPQEDINVFYRFFRDRISWFEADAVCQFHHANLVTVDNSFQFDATRDLLRELDVNDIVWIGLLRPQNSERFMWSNSRPFVTDTGYWAEALPLMDAPLCAVIDPIRDYRWHALRCGGPETASFLCEMPVPAWADVCLIKDMPNLTMQYMADTASIELIRNCQQEGLLRQTCKGKADRDRAMVELICPKERLAAQQRINDMTNSHFKSLHIINSIRTDNNERNDIELQPNYGVGRGALHSSHGQQQQQKNTVQQLIEQFSVRDLMMQSDKSALDCAYAKSTIAPRMAKNKKKIKEEEMMMGDQPMPEAEAEYVPNESKQLHEDEAVVNNEIFELLPHRKRILTQDLKAISDNKEVENNDAQQGKTLTNLTISSDIMKTTTSETSMTLATTTEDMLKTTTQSIDEAPAASTTTTKNTQAALTHTADDVVVVDNDDDRNVSTLHELSSSLSPITIGHAIHPTQSRDHVQQQQRQQTPHGKESTFDTSHFIPPMLLVKSHYVPMAKHEHTHSARTEFNKHHHNKQLNQPTSQTTISDANVDDATATKIESKPISKTTTFEATKLIKINGKEDVYMLEHNAPSESTTITNTNTNATQITNSESTRAQTESTTMSSTTTKNVKGLNKNTVAAEIIGTDMAATVKTSEQTNKQIGQIEVAAYNVTKPTTTTDTTTLRQYLPIFESKTNETIITTTATETSSIELQTFDSANFATERMKTQPLTTTLKTETLAAASETTATFSTENLTTTTTATANTITTTERSFLLDALTEAQYKPNRRRSLTKPETQSYFKKILG